VTHYWEHGGRLDFWKKLPEFFEMEGSVEYLKTPGEGLNDPQGY
jgi:hypothetical protein